MKDVAPRDNAIPAATPSETVVGEGNECLRDESKNGSSIPGGPTAGPEAPVDNEKRAFNLERGLETDTNNEEPAAESITEGSEDEQPKLPMSKARCIALVLTLTGAAFLNVSVLDL
jgi:hypothetical protein